MQDRLDGVVYREVVGVVWSCVDGWSQNLSSKVMESPRVLRDDDKEGGEGDGLCRSSGHGALGLQNEQKGRT